MTQPTVKRRGGARPGAGRKPRLPDKDYLELLNEVVKPRMREVLDKLVDVALTGDVRALKELLDRIYGQAAITGILENVGEQTIRIVREDKPADAASAAPPAEAHSLIDPALANAIMRLPKVRAG